ncbi:hypothetical protein ACVWZX_003543 [Deinococcus sp. UYEF24]
MLRRTHIQTALPFGSQPGRGFRPFPVPAFSVLVAPPMASFYGPSDAGPRREGVSGAAVARRTPMSSHA